MEAHGSRAQKQAFSDLLVRQARGRQVDVASSRSARIESRDGDQGTRDAPSGRAIDAAEGGRQFLEACAGDRFPADLAVPVLLLVDEAQSGLDLPELVGLPVLETDQDIAVLQAIVVFSAAAFVLINLTVDLLYPVFDPRLRVRQGALA